jgi:thioredoxin-like negative regulator of GroEL
MAPIVDGLERKYGGAFPIVRVNVDRSSGRQLARAYGFIGQPTFIFLDRAGQEARRLLGAQTVETFEREIQRLLAQPAP